MTKLTLQEQMLKAGLVSSKKAAKVQRTAKKSRVQAREAREAVEENKKAQIERDKLLSEQQKQAVLAKEFKAQVKQLIEMNRITVAKGNITFNFTDGNLIKKIEVDKQTQAQLINGRLAIARLVINASGDCEYAIIPAVVADKIAQRDADSIICDISGDKQPKHDAFEISDMTEKQTRDQKQRGNKRQIANKPELFSRCVRLPKRQKIQHHRCPAGIATPASAEKQRSENFGNGIVNGCGFKDTGKQIIPKAFYLHVFLTNQPQIYQHIRANEQLRNAPRVGMPPRK